MDIDYTGDRLILDASLSNEGIQIYLTHSLPPTGQYNLKERIKIINNAKISLFENEQFVKQINAIDLLGNYADSTFRPQLNQNYSLKVEVDSFPVLITKPIQLVAPPPKFELELLDRTVDDNNRETINLNIKIENPKELSFFSLSANLFANGNAVSNWYELLDAAQANGYCGFVNENPIGFTNECFDENQDIKLAIHAREKTMLDSLNITISTIDSLSYEKIKTTYKAEDLELIFVDPTVTPSNVIGGYGIFRSINKKTRVLILE